MRTRCSMWLGLLVLLTACSESAEYAGVSPPPPPPPTSPTYDITHCTDCHYSDSVIVATQTGHFASDHGATKEPIQGTDAPGCDLCHTTAGFWNAIVGEEPLVENPLGVHCLTCHTIHHGESDHYALTASAPLDLHLGGHTVDLGPGNLCAHCHQATGEHLGSVKVGGDSVTLNAAWGPHAASQANVFTATGFHYLPGTRISSLPDGPHAAHFEIGCTGCHMQTPLDTLAGGHTMELAYATGEATEPGRVIPALRNDGTCESCHDGVEGDVTLLYYGTEPRADTLLNPVLSEDGVIDGTAESTLVKLEHISQHLRLAGALTPTGEPNDQTVEANLAAALANYLLLREDGSLGVHHPSLTDAVLQNTLEWLEAHYPLP